MIGVWSVTSRDVTGVGALGTLKCRTATAPAGEAQTGPSENRERLVAYSFRHTVKQALDDSGAKESVHCALMGHAGNGVHENYGATYKGRGLLRDALKAALTGVDDNRVPFLGNIDSINYSPAERVITKAAKPA